MFNRPFKVRDDVIAVLAGLAVRGFFLPAADGAYTDGILALNTFKFGLSYWPPFYALTAWLLAWIPGMGLENAGRIISFLAGALTVVPLMALAKVMFGRRAARWAAAAWILSPLPMRWSLQPMTDALMVALWTGSLAALALSVEAWQPRLFAQPEGASPLPDAKKSLHWMILASLLGAIATLTRYQGILLLLPIVVVVAWRVFASRHSGLRTQDSKLFLSLLPWLMIPLWFVREGLGPLMNHFQQFQERAATASDYWMMIEEFVMRAPYFATWGLFGFFIYGLLRVNWSTWRLRWAGWLGLALTAAILALQSAFMSYQERYLLPLVPFVCLAAGHGFATWQRRCERAPLRFWMVTGPALAYAFVFSFLVAWHQTRPFEDFKAACEDVAEMPAAKTAVYTNEFYNPSVSGDDRIGPPKARFWTGKEAKYLPQQAWGVLKPGDVIILSSWYSMMPLDQFRAMIDERARSMPVAVVARYQSETLPLLPDLMMAYPMSANQNPLAMIFRYNPQYFETVVLQMKGAAPIDIDLPPAGADAASQQHQQRQQQLEQLKKQLEKTK
ncbi:glycosyltransferase family 39 protein [bacterium]|nr:glycosyltransferase family 39 protein [bacterium]